MGVQVGVTGKPTPAVVLAQLERIRTQPPFDRSPVLSRFLSYAVERSLRSDPTPAKEYTIGLEVFDKADDFDPRIDTIVRVQARRLREALLLYYQHDGKADRVLLEMPRGHYAVRASLRTIVAEGAPAHETEDAAHCNTSQRSAALPVPRTPLIGRDFEMAKLVDLFQVDKVRMLSITGVGGTGKTRLARALADRLGEAYPGGVLFLDLTPITESAVLVDALAEQFNARPRHGQSLLSIIAERLRDQLTDPLLLVLDNFEGVLEGAELLGELLDASAMLSIVVTSRVALHLYGETEFPLSPLAVPPADWQRDAVELATVPAVQLFLSRVKSANPHADFSSDMDAVADLCVRLDGLPLAIELVAAQAGLLSPRQMLERFTGHLDLPENPARDAPSRQRSLRRTIDWSHDLLDDAAQCAWRRLSVFAGGFTLEAAEAVGDTNGDLGTALLPSLSTLLAMGLVYVRSEGGEPRFAMLETLRAYGRERLSASDEREAVSKAHAAYCVVLAEEGIGNLEPDQRDAWLKRCDLEQDNFRRALRHLLQCGPQRWALRLGHALFAYWEQREKFHEGRRLLDAISNAVPVEPDAALWAKVTIYAATLAAFEGDDAASDAGFSRSLVVCRRLGDRRGVATALNALGVHARLRGDEVDARAWLGDALVVCREIGDKRQIAAALSNLARCDLVLGNTEGVQQLFAEAHDLFIANEDPASAAWCINHLGDVARAQGDLGLAAEHYERAEAEFTRLADAWGVARSMADRGQLAIDHGDLVVGGRLFLDALAGFEGLNHQRGMATVADSIAQLAHIAGQPEHAAKLLAAAESWRSALGYIGRRKDLKLVERLHAQLRRELDSATAKALHDEGRRMSASDVAACLEAILGGIDR